MQPVDRVVGNRQTVKDLVIVRVIKAPQPLQSVCSNHAPDTRGEYFAVESNEPKNETNLYFLFIFCKILRPVPDTL